MGDVATLEGKIRDLINNQNKQNILIKDTKLWHQLCSSLDVIGDTEIAIESYLSCDDISDKGLIYIFIYGILQCLFLQQDAIKHMTESLKILREKNDKLGKIRHIRNDSIGHPTKRDKNVETTSNFIERMSMSKNGFILMIAGNDENELYKREYIDITELIKIQRECHKVILQRIYNKLIEEQNMHKAKFRAEKLVDIFSKSDYIKQKVIEGCSSSDKRIGLTHIEMIDDIIKKFEAFLKKRNILPFYMNIEYEMKIIKYTIDELKVFFSDNDTCYLNNNSAYIFANYLNNKCEDMKNIAHEIDEDYEKDL
ncbi:MAG: hypothetical protein HQK88_09755 [Nitrospirae bacterium]|nr:hypothetical protein [Nitrospirota bacterium]MBF0534456.1 hypothetical protein [Nitrospirota bacterium]MBF0617082.1 hypothetical protein [Nitrospirota bacterium]